MIRLDAMISIHAPRVGGDRSAEAYCQHCKAISIHAPRVGGDGVKCLADWDRLEFQSTPPVWGATRVWSAF